MASIVKMSIEYFADPEKGRPISNGSIYVGIIDLDPEIPANQKQISVLQENGTIVEVAQPLSTSAGGVPIYNNSPVTIIVDGDYSLKVLDKNDAQVYYVPYTDVSDATEFVIVNTIADLRATSGTSIDQPFQVLGYYDAGDGGGGPIRLWKNDGSPGTYVDNGGSIIVPTGGDGSEAFLTPDKTPLSVIEYGALGDGSDATDEFIASDKSSPVPEGSYELDDTVTGDYFLDENVTISDGKNVNVFYKYSKNIPDFNNSYKKRIKRILPYRHTDYAAAVALWGSIYPQTFVIDEVADEIFVISVSPQTVSVYTWSTGAYKQVFNLGATVTTESAVILYEGNSRFLYTRAGNESLYKYNITTLPTNLTVLASTTTIQLGVDRTFSYKNGTWTCADRGEQIGLFRTRNRFIRYDENFDRVGDFDIGVMDAGIIEGVTFEAEIPKLQAFTEGNGYFAIAQGGQYISGTPTKYQYQGLKLFNQNGVELHTSLMLPDVMIDILTSEGLQPDQIENEGVQVMDDGTIYTLYVTATSSTDTGISTVEGIEILEEFSTDERAVDFSSAAITYSGTDIRLTQSGLWPRSRDKSGNNRIFNPLDGSEFTTYDQIMDYMISVNMSVFKFYGSSVSAYLTDANGDPVINAHLYKIWNTSNSTFWIETLGITPRFTRVYGTSGSRITTEYLMYGTLLHDWPSLGIGLVQSVNVTVTGAEIRHHVSVSFTIGLSGTLLWGEVTASNTVTVYQYNPTVGIVDVAGSGTISVIVKRVN